MKNIYLSLTRLKIYLLSTLLVLSTFSFVISQVYSGNFKLSKVDAHYLPELKETPAIRLPGSNIKAGLYKYIPGDGGFTGKIGFLIDEKKFLFLQSNRSGIKEGEYGLAGNITYGIYKDYLLMDVSSGGTDRNGMLFLFRFSKNEIHFLDVISKGSVAGELLGFVTNVKEEKYEKSKYGPFEDKFYWIWEMRSPVWMQINDVNNGIATIDIVISKAFKFKPYFKLFLQIKDNKLKISFDPNLYKPLFEREEKLTALKKNKRDQYYIYGYLSKQLRLDEIEKMLESKPKYKNLICLLREMGNVDGALHSSMNEEKFRLVQYKLKGE